MLKPYNRAELAFETIREIGAEGKNSTVFLAKDHQLNAELVIKRIAKLTMPDQALYFQEASILYQSEHANVVPVHYACEDKDYIYIAMPYFEKGSLKALLNNRFLTVREIVRLSVQFLSGLHNIHTKGLIHFDIKPDNILLSKRGEALVSDFGLAQQMTPEGVARQDISYQKITPPERLARKADFTVAHDIYQVGATVYRMCVGEKAFHEQWDAFFPGGVPRGDLFVAAVINGTFPDRKRFPEQIPQRLRTIVVKCLAPAEDDRYRSVLEITNALSEIDGPELDWRYDVQPDGTRTWLKVSDGLECILTVDPKGDSIAKKQNKNGVYNNIRANCVKDATSKSIRDFIKSN